MSATAGKTEFNFEPKMAVPADATGTTNTPDVMRPTLGPLANLRNYTGRLAYVVRVAGGATSGTAVVRLIGGGENLYEQEIDLNGQTTVAGEAMLSLYNLNGGQRLNLQVEITSAANAGVSLTVDARLEVEQPLVLGSC